MESDIGRAIALLGIGAFAIQRFTELVEPFVSKLSLAETAANRRTALGAMTFWGSFILVAVTGTPLLRLIDSRIHPIFDFVVTALVLSAGTEGVNIITKYLEYTKLAKKETRAVAVRIRGPSSPVIVGGRLQLTAEVTGAPNDSVQWAIVSQGTMATIDANGAISVPDDAPAGRVQVAAISVYDPSVSGVSYVRVVSA